MIKEACVETLEECILAEKNGANRLELCGRLDLGGITPDFELVKSVMNAVKIPMKVMIRNRGGNFTYSEEEFQIMKKQMAELKTLGVFGFVFGFLNSENEMEFPHTIEFCEHAAPFDITIHKAFDICKNPFETFQKLKKLPHKVSLLTSGQELTAEGGKAFLKQMVDNQEGKIKVIVAGKVTYENIELLHEYIGANEYHGKKIVG
jgi:copper homeostasis protein